MGNGHRAAKQKPLPKFESPWLPTVLGTAMTFIDSSGDVVKRSWILLAFLLWLFWDLWAWTRRKQWTIRWKNIVFCGSCGVAAILFGFSLRYDLNSYLIGQQEDAFQRLTVSAQLPRSGNPTGTRFTVTNGSSQLIGKHTLSCEPVLLVGNDGFMSVVGTNLEVVSSDSNSNLGIGGDAQSDSCLKGFIGFHNVACFDVKIEFSYNLKSQPSYQGSKKFRFVATPFEGALDWVPQPVAEPISYCRSFVKGGPILNFGDLRIITKQP